MINLRLVEKVNGMYSKMSNELPFPLLLIRLLSFSTNTMSPCCQYVPVNIISLSKEAILILYLSLPFRPSSDS